MRLLFSDRLFVAGMRAAGLFGKFALLFCMANYLKPQDVGLYGLLVAAVSFSIYLIGFDFYVFTSREIFGVSKEVELVRLKSHLAWVLVCYVVFLPTLFFILFDSFLPGYLAPFFFLLLLLEHLSAETNRFLVMRERQFLAGVNLFVRTGLWCIFCIAGLFFFESLRNLDFIIYCWMGGVVTSLAFLLIKNFSSIKSLYFASVDWGWIFGGLRVALPLLAATLAAKAISTLDRYFIKLGGDASQVGVYVFYFGVAAAVVSIVETGVMNFFYPAMIRLQKEEKYFEYNKTFLRLKRALFYSALSLGGTSLIAMQILPNLLREKMYAENVNVFYFCLSSAFVALWSLAFYYDLYARGLDRYAIRARIVGLVVFIVGLLIFSNLSPIFNVAASVLISSLATLCVSWAYGRISLARVA